LGEVQADCIEPSHGLKLGQDKRVVVKRFRNRLEKPDHLENFNLIHSKIVPAGQNFSGRNPGVVRVSAPEIGVAAISLLALVANMEVVTVREGGST
jgi:hypothetical protein